MSKTVKMSKLDRRNMTFFGLGTIGRDMFYALEANALLYYLSNVLNLPIAIYVATSMVFTVLRVFDAVNDPFMGLIIDNCRSKHGKFKPPMVIGAVVAAACYLVLFADFGLRNYGFVAIFAVAYILWDIFYGLNDIAYWSMLPSLSVEQKVRENMGAFARICANIGMFAVMVLWQPVTSGLGNTSRAWFIVAAVVTGLMLFFQMFTVIGVKERPEMFRQEEEKTSFKEMVRVITKNDQLLWTTLSMSLFNIGYMTTTTISIYYMQYVYGDEGMYAILAAVVGVAQLFALSIFPACSKKASREQLYFIATALVLVGYIVFLFSGKSLAIIVIAALLLFFGQAFIQLLMLMFLEDTIEYGQWKLGKRNESIVLSVQPLINKIGGAISMGIVSMTLIWSGIKQGDEAAEAIDDEGKLIIKIVMLVIPLVLIVIGYVIYKAKYKISAEMYQKMIIDLISRGEIKDKE